MNNKFGNVRAPSNCGGYRTPESYEIGSQAYLEWLNCNWDSHWDASNGGGGWSSGGGNSGGGGIVIMNSGGGNSGGVINTIDIPQNPVDTTIINGVPVNTSNVPQPMTVNAPNSQPTIYTMAQIKAATGQTQTASDKLKEFYNNNQLLSIGILAVAAYVLIIKK